jgi:2-polyprenyl-3-methyl-5-hydroxy-6-metoxy-1,4-benzoquinol methylase
MTEDLDQYVGSYTDFNDWLICQRYELLKRHFTGSTCLELGPANGEGTQFLLEHFDSVVAVEGSQQAAESLQKRFPGERLRVICSFFEQLAIDETFDTVVLAHVLEHVDDPGHVLAVARRHVAPGGVLIVDVPNAMSLHRQIGVEMGLLGAVTDLHEGDLSIGHKRVYTPEAFRAEVERAGLAIERFGGVFIKVLSNAQSPRAFDDAQLRALLTIGERYPEIAAEMYVIARPA